MSEKKLGYDTEYGTFERSLFTPFTRRFSPTPGLKRLRSVSTQEERRAATLARRMKATR